MWANFINNNGFCGNKIVKCVFGLTFAFHTSTAFFLIHLIVYENVICNFSEIQRYTEN